MLSSAPSATSGRTTIEASGAREGGAALAPASAAALCSAGAATIVDVREVDEYRRERIPGAALCPASVAGPRDFPAARAGHTLLILCRSGNRAKRMAEALAAAGRTDARVIEGGLVAWATAGLPVERNASAPLPIIRQVMITVGVVLLGVSALAAFVNPWWIAAAAAVGAGLLFAGITGVCALAVLLGVMPWNHSRAPSAAAVGGAVSQDSGCCGGNG